MRHSHQDRSVCRSAARPTSPVCRALALSFLLVGCGPNDIDAADQAKAPGVQLEGIELDQKSDALTVGPSTLRVASQRNKCIDIRSSNQANRTAVQVYDCNGTDAQNFRVTGGQLRVFNNKCVDVLDGADRNGTALQIWDCSDNNGNQKWIARADGLIQWAGHNKCIDVPNSNTTNGTQLIAWDCDATKANQKWSIVTPLLVTSPANTSAPAPAPAPQAPQSPQPNNVSCKRGIAYGEHSQADLRAIAPRIGWWYNWSPGPESAVSSIYQGLGLDFVPMVWGGQFSQANLTQSLPNSKYLLAFNEPNFFSQANLTPEQAAALWPQIEAIARAHNMKIVSPALNYCGGGCNATSPFDWFDRFFAACKNCQVDYLAFHWYACSKEAVTSMLGQFETRYNRPIWLTEFACLDSGNVPESQQIQYMKDAVAILEADPKVFRYAWFTGRWPAQPTIGIFGADGQLTSLGKAYLEAPGASCH